MLKEKKFDLFDGLLETTPQLLNSLRNPDFFNNYKSSLLIQAAEDGNRDVFRKLLHYPQDFGIVNRFGNNVFHRVARCQNDGWWFDMLKTTIHNANELKKLINKKSDFDMTPLHCAAWCNKHQSIKWLLENQADVNVTNKGGKRADEYDQGDAESKRMIREYRNK